MPRSLHISEGGMADAARRRRQSISLPDPVRGARWIPLTKGKFALVDERDYKRASQFNWCASPTSKTIYAKRAMLVDGVLVICYLHRFIMEIYDERQVDHRNGNGLNCRRKNLRVCDSQKNNMNRSKTVGCTSNMKGVCWDPSRKRWRSTIKMSRKYINLGRFMTEAEAASAYNDAAVKYFGEFAKLNVIPQ